MNILITLYINLNINIMPKNETKLVEECCKNCLHNCCFGLMCMKTGAWTLHPKTKVCGDFEVDNRPWWM